MTLTDPILNRLYKKVDRVTKQIWKQPTAKNELKKLDTIIESLKILVKTENGLPTPENKEDVGELLLLLARLLRTRGYFCKKPNCSEPFRLSPYKKRVYIIQCSSCEVLDDPYYIDPDPDIIHSNIFYDRSWGGNDKSTGLAIGSLITLFSGNHFELGCLTEKVLTDIYKELQNIRNALDAHFGISSEEVPKKISKIKVRKV